MERYLDVSELEPPEPLEEILSTITTLSRGEYLRVLHRREPFPLYPLLEQQGFCWRTTCNPERMYHIFIWRVLDPGAGSQVLQQFDEAIIPRGSVDTAKS